MRILIVADGRSPITRRWLQGLVALRHEVALVSTFPCQPPENISEFQVIPVAFAGLSGSQVSNRTGGANSGSTLKQTVSRARSLFLRFRYQLGPLTLAWYGPRFARLVEQWQPDLVHALRIPFEGMLAAYTPANIPLAVSVWGNDLTLHARGSRAMERATRRTLQRANGLAADAGRDIRLGRQWGFAPEKAVLTVPGNGGVDLMEISRAASNAEIPFALPPADGPWVINPRGFRPGSVNNDVFFQSIPLILDRNPGIHFLCAAMAGQSEAEQWLDRLKIRGQVTLLPFLPQEALWRLFSLSQVSVSISAHDGTPNSLLEAMACGCFPVVGDIESLREWITPGINGLLVEPSKAPGLAEAVLLAVDNPALRDRAALRNQEILHSRAEVNLVRSQIQVFYQRLVL